MISKILKSTERVLASISETDSPDVFFRALQDDKLFPTQIGHFINDAFGADSDSVAWVELCSIRPRKVYYIYLNPRCYLGMSVEDFKKRFSQDLFNDKNFDSADGKFASATNIIEGNARGIRYKAIAVDLDKNVENLSAGDAGVGNLLTFSKNFSISIKGKTENIVAINNGSLSTPASGGKFSVWINEYSRFHNAPRNISITLPLGLNEFSGVAHFGFFNAKNPTILFSLCNLWENIFRLYTEHRLRLESTKSAIAAIMSRNMSHNLGSHVVTNTKHQIEDLESRQHESNVEVKKQLKGISSLLQYLQERQDFIALIANDEHYPQGPLNFKSAVFDILAMDGPSFRHNSDPVNNYILDNIVRSENIARRKSIAGRNKGENIGIELQLVKLDADGQVKKFKSLEKNEIGGEFADFTLSVNYGLNGRQALLSILENIIRNAAKHNKEAFETDTFINSENNTLLFSVIYRETAGGFEITICDNKRSFGATKEILEKRGIIKDGRLTPTRILREDGGGVDKENKGFKEMLISLAWLRHGEKLPSGGTVSYDTLQQEPWELLEVVGVDNDTYRSYTLNDSGASANLSLGYRFRMGKYKAVHLLTADDLSASGRTLTERLAALPGASLYAVRAADLGNGEWGVGSGGTALRADVGSGEWGMGNGKTTNFSASASAVSTHSPLPTPHSPFLAAIPRLEVVADTETEATLALKLDELYARNVSRRFSLSALPRLRVTESSLSRKTRHDFDAQRSIVREYGGEFDETWSADYPGPFIHYRNHYETSVLNLAKTTAELDWQPDAIYTDSISGGNYTSTLIRTDISRASYLAIIESALVKIAIVDERLFDKYAGRKPWEEPSAKADRQPRWEWLRRNGIYIFSSDETGIYDLWGEYLSVSGGAYERFDYLSIHLGLIDKAGGGNLDEIQKLEQVLKLFAPLYDPAQTKLAIHSGRGGLSQMSDIAFIPLSGIESVLENCKFTLSEFFHGLKYPMPAELALPQVAPAERQRQQGSTGNLACVPRPERSTGNPACESRKTQAGLPVLHSVSAGRSASAARKIFVFTTYEYGGHTLGGLAHAADGGLAPSGVEDFASREMLDQSELAAQFKKIARIHNDFFFYPCAKNLALTVSRHDDYIAWLVGRVLSTVSGPVELHLILHASDAGCVEKRNSRCHDQRHPLIQRLRDDFALIDSAKIWWFAHDSTGIFRHVICKGSEFAAAADKAEWTLRQLCEHTPGPVYAGNGEWGMGSGKTNNFSASASAVSTHSLLPTPHSPCTLRVPSGHIRHLSSPLYLDRLAVWQLRGADDEAALANIFADGEGGAEFALSPNHERQRLLRPRPLLVRGDKPLEEFGGDGERRANYLDSSIWCRYAADDEQEAEIREQFRRNRELGLYDCNNGREYLEFWARLLLNSRLANFESGHGSKIVPIVFHSERKMAALTLSFINGLRERIAKNPAAFLPLEWKFLLVDDHALKPLSGSGGNAPSKLRVICETLAPLFKVEVDGAPAAADSQPDGGLRSYCRAKIYCAETKEQAIEKIRRERFDIILLDYLLNKPDEKDFDTADVLLKEIRAQTSQAERGPMGQLWFFNVSAFSNALDSKLTAEGLHHQENEWYLHKGACPVSTPELFKHSLLTFMFRQVKELVNFHRRQLLGVADDTHSLVDLLAKIYPPADSGQTARQMADKYFHNILNFEMDCKIMRVDIDKNSAIVPSLYPDIRHYDDAFWDHLAHLVHITAYGSPQQWPQMLVNFREVKGTLLKANGERNEAAVLKLLGRMEQYIIGLHSEGRK